MSNYGEALLKAKKEDGYLNELDFSEGYQAGYAAAKEEMRDAIDKVSKLPRGISWSLNQEYHTIPLKKAIEILNTMLGEGKP